MGDRAQEMPGRLRAAVVARADGDVLGGEPAAKVLAEPAVGPAVGVLLAPLELQQAERPVVPAGTRRFVDYGQSGSVRSAPGPASGTRCPQP